MAQTVTSIVFLESSIMLQAMGKPKDFLLELLIPFEHPFWSSKPHQFVSWVDSILSLPLKTLSLACILIG